MPYEPTTNFRDSNNVDLGKKLVTKDYLLSVYGSLLDTLAPGLTFTPELWTWGDNGFGQLGINNSTRRSTPVTTFSGGSNWKQVSSSLRRSAAIKTDGTLWTWGLNSSGVLGTNNLEEKSTPVTTFAGGTNWKQVACGDGHTAAIKTDGTLWTWGNTTFGQIGDNAIPPSEIGEISGRSTPVTTFAGGNNWKQVSCGYRNTAAIKTDGTLWTWGANHNGSLGINNITTPICTPVTTFAGGNDWKQVSGGYSYMAAIKTDGTLWVWGSSDLGKLGTNGTPDRSTPVTTFAGGTNWKQVSAGENHMAAIKTDGTLWVWGNGVFGQLGINAIVSSRSTPVTTFAGGNNWKQVSCGYRNTAAIKTDGSLWVWGINTYAQLGINNNSTRSAPVTTFAGGKDWKQVSGGRFHIAAIKSIDYI